MDMERRGTNIGQIHLVYRALKQVRRIVGSRLQLERWYSSIHRNVYPGRRANNASFHRSAFGTLFGHGSDVRLESAFGCRADHICSERVFRLLTQLRHWPDSYVAIAKSVSALFE